MATPGGSWRSSHPGRSPALLLSIALHGALLVGLARVDWASAPVQVVRPPTVVWLDRSFPVPDTPASSPEGAGPLEPAGEAGAARTPDATLPPAEPLDPRLVEAPEAVETIPPAPAPPLPELTEDERPQLADVAPTFSENDDFPADIDWNEIQQQAIASMSEQLAREQAYMTFSSDAVESESGEPAELGEPRSEGSIFDAPSRARHAVLSRGKSRSRFGRWLSELCHTLSGGGFGFFGASVCAEDQARSDLFALIKPDYMKKRPFCWDPALEDPILAAVSLEAGVSTIKCRLVYADELAALSDLTSFSAPTQARQ